MESSGDGGALNAMDPELFRRMQEAARRFREGESDFEEILTPAGPAHLVRDSGDPRGFRIDFVGDGARHSVPIQEYPASATRPPGYPAPLPFLPGCAATVDTFDQSVTWLDPPEPEEAFARVRRESLDDGWVELHDASGEGGNPFLCVLEKDGTERTVQLAAGDEPPRVVVREQRVRSDT